MAIKPIDEWRAPRVGAKQLALLESLSNAGAVSGDEGAVRKIVLEHVRPLADELIVDAMGNVLVTKRGTARNRLKVMLAAHMDEVGLILTHDDGEGLFRFEAVGSIDARSLPGKPVLVGSKGHPGVIGAKPIHLTNDAERKNAINTDSLRVDLGPGNSSKAKIGERAVFATRFQQMGVSLVGKALDDRIGVATLITLFQNTPPNIDLLAAFTVQEELGLRGATVAGYTLKPDLAIALDCTPAMDHPAPEGQENTLYRSKLDGGPAIYVGDGATLGDPRLIRHVTEVGDVYGIRYQLRQPGGGGTDSGAIHKTRSGVPSISISVPGRYLHTAASLARLDDWKASIALLHAALNHIDARFLKEDR
jgi:endoglucanase